MNVTSKHAVALVAEAMACTALDYDAPVIADDDTQPYADMSAHEVLLAHGQDRQPAQKIAPDFQNVAREYLELLPEEMELSSDDLFEIGANLFIFHALWTFEHELTVEPEDRVHDLYSSSLSPDGVLTVTIAKHPHVKHGRWSTHTFQLNRPGGTRGSQGLFQSQPATWS